MFFRCVKVDPGHAKTIPIAPGEGRKLEQGLLAVTVHAEVEGMGGLVVQSSPAMSVDRASHIMLL
eukprot:8018436-Alexandrium_andersonii.AAC.1